VDQSIDLGASAATGSSISQTLNITQLTLAQAHAMLNGTAPLPATAVYTITPAANGCNGSASTFTARVNYLPSASATPSSQTVCSGIPITQIVPSSGFPGATLSWTRDNNSTVTGIASSGTGNISGTLTNTLTTPVLVTFTITASANGCDGTPVTATVLVNPTPNAMATPSTQTICSGATASSSLTGTVIGTTFSWNIVQTGLTGASDGYGSTISQVLNTPPPSLSQLLGLELLSPATAVYNITPTANGCTGPAATFTATVNPIPAATALPVSQTICSGTSISQIVLNSNVTGTIYNWTRDNTTSVTGIAASGSGNISGTLTNTATTPVTVTFTITYSANGCTGIAITPAVTVNPLTYSTNPVNVTTHVLDAAYFSVTATGTDPVSYQWQVDPKTGSFVGVNNVTGLYSGVTTNKLSLTNVPYSMDGYKYRCIVTGGCGTSVTTSPALLTVLLRPTALIYGGDPNKQYSDQVYLKAVLTDITNSTPVPIPNKTVTFSIGSQTASDTYGSTGGGTDASGIAEAYMLLTQKPVSSFVTSSFAGDAVYASANDKDVFVILCEDATVTYNGASYFGAAPSTGDGLINLSATVSDYPDGYPGNITNATATFHDGSASGTVLGTAAIPVGLNGTGTTQGSASTSMPYKLTTSDIASGGRIWEVWTTANNYYCGQSDTYSAVTLGMPGGDNVTGGGYILMTNTSGQYPGLNNAGKKMNFGLVMKWNKSGKNLQGKVNVIYRGSDGNNYQIKSNAISSIVVTSVDNTGAVVTKNATYKMATISTKATLTKLTATGSVSLGGNLSLTVIAWESLTDKTGKSDRISVQLAAPSGSGMWFSSNWSGGKTVWQLLNGGKIQAFDSQITASYITAGESSDDPRRSFVDTTHVSKSEFGLNVYPNPFADKVSFDLRIPTDSRVTLEISNIMGIRIATVFDQHFNAGDNYRIEYTPENVSSGMLIYRLLIDGRVTFRGKLIHK
jgi:hypothetical protein